MGIQYLQGFWLHPLEIKVFPRWNPLIAGGFLAMASEADNRPKRLEETGDPGTWKRTSAAFNSSVGWWLVSGIFHDFPAQYIWDDDNPRRESPWTNQYGTTEGFWTQLYITISQVYAGLIWISEGFWLAYTKVCFFVSREWFRCSNILHHVAGYEYTGFAGFYTCIAKTHSINFKC